MATETQNFKLKKPDRTDFVNIKEQLTDNMDIIDTEIKEAQDKADKAFQSASNGKTLIKNAITGVDPEVTIPTDATFAQLADAIEQIETGVNTDDATATAEKILAGMTAYVKGVKVTGTMQNRTFEANNNAYTNAISAKGDGGGTLCFEPPTGYYEQGKNAFGFGVLAKNDPNYIAANIKAGTSIFGVQGDSNVVNTSDGTIDAGKILTGYGGYSKGVKVNGNMPNHGAVSHSLPINGSYTIPGGCHNGSGKITQSVNTKWEQTYTPGTWDQSIPAGQYLGGTQTIKGDANLIPANILSGKSIFGVAGSVIAGKKSASGLYTSGSSYTKLSFNNPTKNSASSDSEEFWIMPISGLSFTPSIVIYYPTSPENTWQYPMGMASTITEDGDAGHYGRSFATLSSGFIFKSATFYNQGYLYMREGGFCVPLHRTTSLATYREYCWIAIE